MLDFIYLYQTKNIKLKNAIYLFFSILSKVFVITDRKAPLIKAWQEVFPYIIICFMQIIL
jgi:hypothetical protein